MRDDVERHAGGVRHPREQRAPMVGDLGRDGVHAGVRDHA